MQFTFCALIVIHVSLLNMLHTAFATESFFVIRALHGSSTNSTHTARITTETTLFLKRTSFLNILPLKHPVKDLMHEKRALNVHVFHLTILILERFCYGPVFKGGDF